MGQTLITNRDLETASLQTSVANKEAELKTMADQLMTKQRESVKLQELLITKDSQMCVVRETHQRSERDLSSGLEGRDREIKALQSSVKQLNEHLCRKGESLKKSED